MPKVIASLRVQNGDCGLVVGLWRSSSMGPLLPRHRHETQTHTPLLPLNPGAPVGAFLHRHFVPCPGCLCLPPCCWAVPWGPAGGVLWEEPGQESEVSIRSCPFLGLAPCLGWKGVRGRNTEALLRPVQGPLKVGFVESFA